MTTSRYIAECKIPSLHLDRYEWEIFCKTIQTSCHFTVSKNRGIIKSRYFICESRVQARYYCDDNKTYYHVSNDTRREICNFLKMEYGIYK